MNIPANNVISFSNRKKPINAGDDLDDYLEFVNDEEIADIIDDITEITLSEVLDKFPQIDMPEYADALFLRECIISLVLRANGMKHHFHECADTLSELISPDE